MNILDVLLTALLLADQTGDTATADKILALSNDPEEAAKLVNELDADDKTGSAGDTTPAPSFQL